MIAVLQAPPQPFLTWIGYGIGHIFRGWDHLALLLGLLVVAGSWRAILGSVSAFTAGHSLTLALSALGLVRLTGQQERWVEISIAVSIVWVALENLRTASPSHRGWFSFGFGLVHGFGFAAVLKSHGLGVSPALSLLGFNLGIELGQGLVVGFFLPFLRPLQRRHAGRRWTVRAISAAILAAGVYWVAQRI